MTFDNMVMSAIGDGMTIKQAVVGKRIFDLLTQCISKGQYDFPIIVHNNCNPNYIHLELRCPDGTEERRIRMQ